MISLILILICLVIAFLVIMTVGRTLFFFVAVIGVALFNLVAEAIGSHRNASTYRSKDMRDDPSNVRKIKAELEEIRKRQKIERVDVLKPEAAIVQKSVKCNNTALKEREQMGDLFALAAEQRKRIAAKEQQ